MVVRVQLRNPPPMEPDPAVDRFDNAVAELWRDEVRHGLALFFVTVWVDSSGPIWQRRRSAPYRVVEFAASMEPGSQWCWLQGMDEEEVAVEQLAVDRLEVTDDLGFDLVWLDQDDAVRVRREQFPEF